MNCKDYLFITHHGFIISYDDDDTLDEIDADMKQRGKETYTVTKEDYKAFERSINQEPDFDQPLQSAGGTHGPQGHKGVWDGIKFDSKWEYAFYRYHKEIAGNVIYRNKTEWYPYRDSAGMERRFYYDFTLNGQPYEVKGIFRERDLLKQQATSGLVTFVSGNDIKPLIKELNAKSPNWESDYVTT